MTWIRPEGALTRRDLRIHEAGHFVVGSAFGLPMAIPEIFGDGSGGRAGWDQAEVKRRAARRLPDIDDKSLATVERLAGLNIAACFMAGYCAECINAGDDPRAIYGSRTPDIAHAGQILLKTHDRDTHLSIAWNRAWSVLTDAWPIVLEIAELLPVTQGTHHPPVRFLH
jgi:hypothetical protein